MSEIPHGWPCGGGRSTRWLAPSPDRRERYRDALLAAEPELPSDLVRGETLEEVDAAVEAARRTVARIRERMEAERGKGFPVGAPARGAGLATSGLTPVEKITRGLQQRMLA